MLELDKCWSCLIITTNVEIVVMWHKNKIHMPNTWDSFVLCVPSLKNIIYFVSSLKVVIIGFYSVWRKCKKNRVSQIGFLVLCFKPKTGVCKGGSVLNKLNKLNHINLVLCSLSFAFLSHQIIDCLFLEKHHFLVGFLTILYVELMGLDLLVDTSFSYYHTKLSLFSSWKNVSLIYNHPQLYFNFFVEKIRKRLSLPPPMTLASF